MNSGLFLRARARKGLQDEGSVTVSDGIGYPCSSRHSSQELGLCGLVRNVSKCMVK